MKTEMITSAKGLALIRKHEGLKTLAYKCPDGVWTIGIGHTKDVKPGDTCTESQAMEWLKEDVGYVEEVINKELPGKLNQNQFDALVSFVFNVESGNFQKSTLLRMAKGNTLSPLIFDEFMKWNKAKGKVQPGLVVRRRDEADLYFS